MDCMRMIRYNTSCFRPFSKTGPLLCLRQSKYTNANEIFLCPNDVCYFIIFSLNIKKKNPYQGSQKLDEPPEMCHA